MRGKRVSEREREIVRDRHGDSAGEREKEAWRDIESEREGK